MRILVLTDRYPPYYAGGYEIACATVTEQLRKRGHELFVLTSNYGLAGKTAVDGHIYRLLHRPQDSPSLFQIARWETSDNAIIRQLVQSLAPDVISAWSLSQLFPSLYLTLREFITPILFNLHDLWIPNHLAGGERQRQLWLKSGSNPVKQLAKGMVRTTFQLRYSNWLTPVELSHLDLSHVVFCSQYQHSRHVQAGLPLNDWRVIYNGLDMARFNGTPSFNQERALKVLFVGRLVSEKGAHLAIQAISEMLRRNYHQVRLSIVGVPAYPFEYGESLHRMVEENQLQDYIKFLGMVDNPKLPEIYRQHDVLVFPSTHLEGLPMTLLEAMACGLVVVGTTSGGSSELLKDQINSVVLWQNTPEAIADGLIQLIDNPPWLARLATAGQQLMRERFDIETIAAETETYLLEIVKAARPRPNECGLKRPEEINSLG
ncbi:MAG: glycosyltransferase family 4 protein [Acidobacteria bacterium]|nr:glycosyltransferase family 4 protein [Acidobacteriota bacterium]